MFRIASFLTLLVLGVGLAACGGGGGGGSGEQVSPNPTGLVSSAVTTNQVTLNWTAPNGTVSSYSVQRCIGSGCTNFAQVGTSSNTTYTDTGLTANLIYNYEVCATTCSDPLSVNTTDTIKPSAPSNLNATATSSSSINLSWTLATDNVAVAGYQIERCTGMGCSNFAQISSTTATTYQDTDLTANTIYFYRVVATDAANNLSAYSGVANATTPAPTITPTDTQAPTAPTNLVATVVGTGINLTWTAATDNVGVTGYRIERCTGSSCTTGFSQIGATPGLSYADSGLAAGSSYGYRVLATDAAGNPSNYSSIARASIAATLATDNGIPVSGPGASYVILAANDLGMHCTDKDFQVFSILPPFNTVHGQVVKKGTNSPVGTTGGAALVTDTAVDVYYAAASNANDPAGANSINTTSTNSQTVFKTNFWQPTSVGTQTFGSQAYRSLYPALDNVTTLSCNSPPCNSVLDLFSPIAPDVGIPVPDPNALYPSSGSAALVANQQTAMSIQGSSANPYHTNTPQKVKRFDVNLPFFKTFPFGGTMSGVNWFSADGIPMMPVDDVGRLNAYPLARVAAVTKGASPLTSGNVLAAVDVVLPVASEADCQTCHASQADALKFVLSTINGYASDLASVRS